MTTFTSRLIFRIPALAFLAAIGCGQSGPKMAKVSGTVLIDGKPLTAGYIQVIPEKGRAASGKIGPDGRFTLTTTDPDDGVITGTHKVTVAANESQGATAMKWLAPKDYADLLKSGLTTTIEGPTQDLKIDLTWKGGKPFVEYFGKE